MKRGVGKCPRWTFLTPRKQRKSINKSGNSFVGHPVLLHIFKIKDKKKMKFQNVISFSETMAYFLALIVDSRSSY